MKWRFLVYIVLVFITSIVLGLCLEMLFEKIFPPITSDGHRVMPIGHIMMSGFLAILFGLISIVIIIKKWSKSK
jgi:membrane-associated phospholipid phosphatase